MIPLPTQQSYHLKCKIVVKDITYLDVQSKATKQVTEKLVHLIPVEGTQRDLFLTAWLPEVSEQVYEIGMKAGDPIYGVFRGAVKRSTKDIKEPHIFVMSRGAEEELKKMISYKPIIEIEVLPESEDEQMDSMKDFQLAGQTKTYNSNSTVAD